MALPTLITHQPEIKTFMKWKILLQHFDFLHLKIQQFSSFGQYDIEYELQLHSFLFAHSAKPIPVFPILSTRPYHTPETVSHKIHKQKRYKIQRLWHTNLFVFTVAFKISRFISLKVFGTAVDNT